MHPYTNQRQDNDDLSFHFLRTSYDGVRCSRTTSTALGPPLKLIRALRVQYWLAHYVSVEQDGVDYILLEHRSSLGPLVRNLMAWFLALPEKHREEVTISFLIESFIFGRPPCLLPGALSAERGWAGLPPPSRHFPPPHTAPGQALSLTQTLQTPQNSAKYGPSSDKGENPTLIDHYAGGGCDAQDGVKLTQDSCFRGAIGHREDITQNIVFRLNTESVIPNCVFGCSGLHHLKCSLLVTVARQRSCGSSGWGVQASGVLGVTVGVVREGPSGGELFDWGGCFSGSCFGGLCRSSGCIPSCGTADDEDQPMVRVEGYKEGVPARRVLWWAVGNSPSNTSRVGKRHGRLREHGLWGGPGNREGGWSGLCKCGGKIQGPTEQFRRTRKPGVLAPLLPLSFIGGYQADMAYGNKLHRIRGEAENIMQFEMDLLELPCGLPSASSIDQARLDNDEKKKLHPAVPPI
uniref:Uncharacterized protein n=1 Tax=Timema monikensis TaxID=170555 RepID=A0A7R9EBN6_9NEOP|nr:unnamed protein product [Timema monikensis]